ncbi:MAG: histidine--tRNA ligase [Planctomycetaceae bacterium]|jgi:histidyl-tRNA synthetase|nr:histidine--tRNA ligase [Planctomycetaceae bacterium]
MSFIKTPVKGMPEQLPADMELREYAMNKIKETYKRYGFSLIDTPAIEHIENLTNKQGGENETLIFKILKRGEKLEKADKISDLCDGGLRYDLTVPLARFYANNMSSLPTPFKSLQIGNAWRADRPQKGRFRQFTQCDIDIIGDNSNLAEIELISATSEMLFQLGLGDFNVRINDRRILKAMAAICDFPQDKYDDVFIALDKMDKIGLEGVMNILKSMNCAKKFAEENVHKYCNFFKEGIYFDSCIDFLGNKLDGVLSSEVINNLNDIILCVRKIILNKGKVVFDPTLVRGMSYYTGPIFEIELVDKSNLSSSIAGGGRYDEMIGKYNDNKIQAAASGFSIGFERIVSILKSKGLKPQIDSNSTAYLISKNLGYDSIENVFVKANTLRGKGQRILVSPKSKNMKVQIDKLIEQGYNKIIEVSELGEHEIILR